MVRQRLGAYAVCRRDDGAVLLVTGAEGSPWAGLWWLPGGGVEHGEHPRDAVRREVLEEAGLAVEVGDVLAVEHWVDASVHHLAVAYEATPEDPGRVLRGEVLRGGEPGERPAWVDAVDLPDLPLLPATAQLLGLPDAAVEVPSGGDETTGGPGVVWRSDDVERGTLSPDGEPLKRQRVGAYAVVGDGNGAVLLTELSALTTAPGSWTLPGGGVDPGESPLDAVVREVREETAHDVRVGELLDVQSRHFTGVAPDGVLEDFHAVRLVFRATAVEVREPRVLEPDSTTAQARWVPLDELHELPLAPTTAASLQAFLDGPGAGGRRTVDG